MKKEEEKEKAVEIYLGETSSASEQRCVSFSLLFHCGRCGRYSYHGGCGHCCRNCMDAQES